MLEDRNWRIAEPRHEVPGIDPAVARLSEMLVAVLSELAMTRERLDTVERLIERHGLFERSAIEAYEPDADAETARTALRKRQISKVMRPLQDDIERDLARTKSGKRFPSSEEPKP